MNQDQVKEKLLLLESEVDEFSVIFSGKQSKKVDGLYRPEEREIIIHNRNMTGDAELMYTAIHEYAHHLQFTRSAVPVSVRSHTGHFWNIFHTLLVKATALGIYTSPFETVPEFLELTRRIREEFIGENGRLMRKLGALLIDAMELCKEHNVSFEDYVDRALQLHRNEAKKILAVASMDIDPAVGYENMKTLARIKETDARAEAQKSFQDGESPDMVKYRYLSSPQDLRKDDPEKALEKEKERILRSIASLKVRLEEIEARLEAYHQ